MSNNKRPQIKNEEQYEALRDQGHSKEKAARIANTPDNVAAKKGGKAPAYEKWTREELYQKARKIGLSGISKLRKKELIEKLRSH